jgi:hypothetical protein
VRRTGGVIVEAEPDSVLPAIHGPVLAQDQNSRLKRMSRDGRDGFIESKPDSGTACIRALTGPSASQTGSRLRSTSLYGQDNFRT